MTGEYKYIKNQNEKSKISPRLTVEDDQLSHAL